MKVNKIGILGSGIMGSGIAQVFAQSDYGVIIRDVKEKILEEGVKRIEGNLSRKVEKGKISLNEKKSIMKNIDTTVKLKEIGDCNLVIEAVPEEVELKKSIFGELSEFVGSKAIIASNTSSISITELANSVSNQSRFIGMHFINPAPVINLVEIIKGIHTSENTLKSVKKISEEINKTPVVVKDSPGFALNRLLIPMINEAFYMLQEGTAGKKEIDQVMKLGANHPMGPLELGDLVGLDTVLHIMETLHEEFGESKYRPCPLLRKYVRADKLGKKSGEGIYSY